MYPMNLKRSVLYAKILGTETCKTDFTSEMIKSEIVVYRRENTLKRTGRDYMPTNETGET